MKLDEIYYRGFDTPEDEQEARIKHKLQRRRMDPERAEYEDDDPEVEEHLKDKREHEEALRRLKTKK